MGRRRIITRAGSNRRRSIADGNGHASLNADHLFVAAGKLNSRRDLPLVLPCVLPLHDERLACFGRAKQHFRRQQSNPNGIVCASGCADREENNYSQ
jgi:hypothetical protein